MARLIEELTKQGQRVCDPFAGGGTTLAVGARLGRSMIGADADKAAIETMRHRLGLLA